MTIAGVLLVITLLVLQSRASMREARQRAKAADELVTFMLQDLGRRLDEFEGVKKLDPGFDTALAYFEELSSQDMQDETLARYFDALTSAGDLRLREGNDTAALRIFQRSSEISSQLVERDANSPDAWSKHGDSFVSLALTHWHAPEQAIVYSNQALEYFDRAVQLAPTDFTNQMRRIVTLNNLGASYTMLRDFGSARDQLRASLHMNQEVRQQSWPESPQSMDRLLGQEAESTTWLTEVELQLGNLQAALDWHRREVTIRREELSNRDNPGQLSRLGNALAWGGLVYEYLGDEQAAHAKRSAATEIFQQLMQRDGGNFCWQHRYITTVLQRASADIYMGNRALARDAIATASARLEQLQSQFPESTTMLQLQARLELAWAREAADSSSETALQHALRAMSHLDEQVRSAKPAYRSVILHAEAAVYAAFALTEQGIELEAHELARSEIDLIDRAIQTAHMFADQHTKVVLLFLAGERQESEAFISELYERGYRAKRLEYWSHRLERI